jgi:hypothetical protein
MPKIKDLGINVIPDTMRPPEIGGGGGGGGGCGNFTVNCIGCTNVPTFCQAPSVGCTHLTNPCIGCTDAPTACICTNFTVNCIGCTNNPTFCQTPSNCGCTNITNPCIGVTKGCEQPSICACTLASPCHTGGTLCGALSACGGGGATVCACSAVASICTGGSPTIITITPTTPQILQAGGLTREHIATLKDQLKQHISALEEAEKSIGPRTAEAIDAREKELNSELEQLKARRSELGKK